MRSILLSLSSGLAIATAIMVSSGVVLSLDRIQIRIETAIARACTEQITRGQGRCAVGDISLRSVLPPSLVFHGIELQSFSWLVPAIRIHKLKVSSSISLLWQMLKHELISFPAPLPSALHLSDGDLILEEGLNGLILSSNSRNDKHYPPLINLGQPEHTKQENTATNLDEVRLRVSESNLTFRNKLDKVGGLTFSEINGQITFGQSGFSIEETTFRFGSSTVNLKGQLAGGVGGKGTFVLGLSTPVFSRSLADHGVFSNFLIADANTTFGFSFAELAGLGTINAREIVLSPLSGKDLKLPIIVRARISTSSCIRSGVFDSLIPELVLVEKGSMQSLGGTLSIEATLRPREDFSGEVQVSGNDLSATEVLKVLELDRIIEARSCALYAQLERRSNYLGGVVKLELGAGYLLKNNIEGSKNLAHLVLRKLKEKSPAEFKKLSITLQILNTEMLVADVNAVA